eukprot:559033_1
MRSLALLFSCFLQVIHGGNIHFDDGTHTPNVTNTSDVYIVYVSQWRPEACRNSNAMNCMNSSITSNITICGEWIAFFDSRDDPSECTNEILKESDIAPIKNELELLWPTYSNTQTNFQFWSDEWAKHGTCWYIQSPFSFFQQGLDYSSKYDIETRLANSHIVPGKGLYYSDRKYIEAFKICMDWMGKGVDCPEDLHTNCNSQIMLIP